MKPITRQLAPTGHSRSESSKLGPLFSQEFSSNFRALAFDSPKETKIIHNLIDENDKKFHWMLLHWAAYSGHVKQMRTLVKYGANCSILLNLGTKPTHPSTT